MVQKLKKFQNHSCFGRGEGLGVGTAKQSRGTSSLCRSSGTEGKTSGALPLI